MARRPVWFAKALGLLAAVSGWSEAARAQPVQGDVRSAGFQAAVPGRFIIRNGQWFPILVELTAQSTEAREVELRCERRDIDGDRVVYTEPYVVVNPGAVRRVWCYAVSLKEDAWQALDVEVVDRRDGALLTRLPVPGFEPISNDTLLVLDVSQKLVTALDRLDRGSISYTDPARGNRPYYRTICVATLPARDLPDRWFGLEAVDVLVWDEPDPDVLQNPAQLTALIEWVRHGGQLVLGIGPSWSKLQKSRLAEILPLVGAQAAVEVQQLDRFAARFAAGESFRAPIAVAAGQPAPGAQVTFWDSAPGAGVERINLIALRCVGSGLVVATAARLRDLTSLNLRRDFLGALLDLNPTEAKFLEEENKRYFHEVVRLYDPIVERIEFRRAAGVRMLAALAFVAAYILVATFGAWAWLKRHALTHLSWTAFAGCAAVASVLSLGAVGLARGVTGSVHSVSFVDLEAGADEARAQVYFGYKSSRRQRVDLSLPGAGNWLRPLATGRVLSSADYATPVRYAAIPGDAALRDTLLRATLKQFEGFWHGTIAGSVRGALTASRSSGQITPESWLQNDLDVDLLGGYLLYIDPRNREQDADGGVPWRAAGLNSVNYRPQKENRYWGSRTVPPAVNVLAVKLPPLKRGERVDGLWVREYAEYEQRLARYESSARPDPEDEPMLPTLRHYQLEEWIGAFGLRLGSGFDPFFAAALLASTRNLYLHNSSRTDFASVGRPLTTEGLPDLDVTHWLMRGQAVLLLLADAPGPARLVVGDRALKADEGRTLYRVRIPLDYRGAPPRGTGP